MRPNLFALRLMMLAFLATAAVSSAAVACPDLSGTYQYPGVEGLAAVCEKKWEGREDLPLPGPGGFYISAFEPHQWVIEQQGCETLVIHTRVGFELTPRVGGQSEEKVITLDLRKGGRREVEWGEDSLFIRQKFVPEGFRLPFSRNLWELQLKKLDGGGLEYHLRDLERGRLEGEVRCGLRASG